VIRLGGRSGGARILRPIRGDGPSRFGRIGATAVEPSVPAADAAGKPAVIPPDRSTAVADSFGRGAPTPDGSTPRSDDPAGDPPIANKGPVRP